MNEVKYIFDEAIEKGWFGDTVKVVRRNGRIFDFVLEGEKVQPHEVVSIESLDSVIREIASNENNASWSTLLDKLQSQGIQQVSLVVTDGFKGLEQMISQAYPLAKQQRCLIHISRNLASKVKRADRAVILKQFKTIYRAKNLEMAVQALEDFIAEWKPKYRKVMESLENTDNLLTFNQFSYQIWHSIYSTNLIESLNKEIKRQTKKRLFFLTRRLWNVI